MGLNRVQARVAERRDDLAARRQKAQERWIQADLNSDIAPDIAEPHSMESANSYVGTIALDCDNLNSRAVINKIRTYLLHHSPEKQMVPAMDTDEPPSVPPTGIPLKVPPHTL